MESSSPVNRNSSIRRLPLVAVTCRRGVEIFLRTADAQIVTVVGIGIVAPVVAS